MVEVRITTIGTEDPTMIADFDDFCLYVYCIVDEICQRIQPLLHRPGPKPTTCSDSELLTLALVGECRGWDMETNLLSHWQAHRDLFPQLPSQSRFNRRRRNLALIFNVIRRSLLQVLDVAQDPLTVIDSLPVPVVQFHLAPASTADWDVHDAAFGRCASKKQTIYGYKLHLLLTVGGVILDFELAPANVTDLEVGTELLAEHTDLTVVGDKAYISQAVRAELREVHRVQLLALPRRNQAAQVPPAVRQAVNQTRQIVETVNGQLTEQFNIEHNHAHSFRGLCTRLYTKVTAHTLCIYLNRLLGAVDFLQIKKLAFPN
jgi:hypothetical protein